MTALARRQVPCLFECATTAINRKLVAYLAGDWCFYASSLAGLAARGTAVQAEQAWAHLAAWPSGRTAYQTFMRLHPSP